MTVLTFDGVDDQAFFSPITAALSNLANGAATMVALCCAGSGQLTALQLRNSIMNEWYHSVGFDGGDMWDDDGLIGVSTGMGITGDALNANNFRIMGVDWPGTGAALERFHRSGPIGSAEAWTHANSSGNNGGLRAGPGTSGRLYIASEGGARYWNGYIALVAVWAGVRFTDANWLDLWTNKKTSDWFNHPAGTPTTLIELNTLTPVDIGSSPSTLSSIGAATLTGPDPTGWTFDGIGGDPPQQARPDADVTTTGWTTTPLYSKIEEDPAVDSDFITATAS